MFMASYTANYGLHQWEATDNFLRTDFNTDFGIIDGALAGLESDKPELVAGAYAGDDAMSRTISLGAAPKAVLVTDESGALHNGQAAYGGFALPGHACIHGGTVTVQITADGFQVGRGYAVSGSYWADVNNSGMTYYFMALV